MGPPFRLNSVAALNIRALNKRGFYILSNSKNFRPRKFIDGIGRKLRFSHALRQSPPRHDRFDDSNTYSHWKLCLWAMRYMFNSVDWFSHYTRTNFQLATLTLELLFHTCPTNLYLIYWLTHHMLFPTSCRFLSKSHITLSLKPKHVRYHFPSSCSPLYTSLH